MVIWMIGLSGAGKTTIAQNMMPFLNHNNQEKWVLVDGDNIRNMYGESAGHHIDGRKINASRMIQHCQFLEQSGKNVLACILSIFPEDQLENRIRFQEYRQVYIKANMETLIRRDNKRLYARAMEGKERHVVGMDIDFPTPVGNDFVLENDNDNMPVLNLAKTVISGLELDGEMTYFYAKGDRLENRNTYRYSLVVGDRFFDVFRKSRDSARALADKFISEIGQDVYDSPLDSAIVRSKIDDLASQQLGSDFDLVNVTEFLVSKIRKLEVYDWDNSADQRDVFYLLKRFEFSKKIYQFYQKNEFKKIHNEYGEPLNYFLLYYLLTNIHDRLVSPQKEMCQNSMLKIGDTAISLLYSHPLPSSFILAKSSISNEQEILKIQYGI